MSETSYKILAAKRLAIDPNMLLFATEDHRFNVIYVTTPDGQQHIFDFADLRRPPAVGAMPAARPSPAIPVAETGQKGVGQPSAEDKKPVAAAKHVAKPKSKSVQSAPKIRLP